MENAIGEIVEGNPVGVNANGNIVDYSRLTNSSDFQALPPFQHDPFRPRRWLGQPIGPTPGGPQPYEHLPNEPADPDTERRVREWVEQWLGRENGANDARGIELLREAYEMFARWLTDGFDTSSGEDLEMLRKIRQFFASRGVVVPPVEINDD